MGELCCTPHPAALMYLVSCERESEHKSNTEQMTDTRLCSVCSGHCDRGLVVLQHTPAFQEDYTTDNNQKHGE